PLLRRIGPPAARCPSDPARGSPGSSRRREPMSHALRSIATAALLAALAGGSARAATPSSGTLTPLTSPVTWTGTMTGSNPTNNIPGSDGPDCSAVPNTCDDFLLTITIPAGYSLLHPTHVITIKVQWPN